ncbi:hypothetical protein Bhyg_04244, partial [Pseudolycoriella hygida]
MSDTGMISEHPDEAEFSNEKPINVDWKEIPKSIAGGNEWVKHYRFNKYTQKTKCILCEKQYSGCFIQNMKRHLCLHHTEEAAVDRVSIKRRKSSKDEPQSNSKRKREGKLSKGDYIKNCVLLAAVNMVAFLLFNSPFFRNLTLIHATVTKTIVNSSNIGNFIRQTEIRIRHLIASEIKNRLISIKLDIATRHHRSMLCVNVQYYCSNRKQLVIRTLGCVELRRSHKSSYLEQRLYSILSLYEIDKKNIYSYTSDNGANLLRLGKLIKKMQHSLNLAQEWEQLQDKNVPDSSASDEELEPRNAQSNNGSIRNAPVVSGETFNLNSAILMLQTDVRALLANQTTVMQSLKEHDLLLKRLNDKLCSCEAYIKDSQIRLDSLEQDTLVNSIEISGVTFMENEDLASIVVKIGNVIGFKLSASEIVSVHRRGKQIHLGPPPLVVFFKDMSIRNGFFSAFRNNNGLTLTDIGAKIFKTQNDFKYLWTKNGCIYLRKNDDVNAVVIDHHTDFDRLLEHYRYQYFERLFSESSSPKKTWREINILLGKRDKKPKSYAVKVNNLIVEESSCPDVFNAYYANVGPDLAKKVPVETTTLAHVHARDLLNKAKLRNKLVYDKNDNPIKLNIGDKVVVTNDDKKQKHEQSYLGPFKIVEIGEFATHGYVGKLKLRRYEKLTKFKTIAGRRRSSYIQSRDRLTGSGHNLTT